MKIIKLSQFIALLGIGCGGDNSESDSSESNHSYPVESSKVTKIDLNDPEILNKIIAEAFDWNKLQQRGKEGEELWYTPNQQKPYTGLAKNIHENGQLLLFVQISEGKEVGIKTAWYKNGQKCWEESYKDGKANGLWTRWYESGAKWEEGNHRNGKREGLWIYYDNDGTERSRRTYNEGKPTL